MLFIFLWCFGTESISSTIVNWYRKQKRKLGIDHLLAQRQTDFRFFSLSFWINCNSAHYRKIAIVNFHGNHEGLKYNVRCLRFFMYFDKQMREEIFDFFFSKISVLKANKWNGNNKHKAIYFYENVVASISYFIESNDLWISCKKKIPSDDILLFGLVSYHFTFHLTSCGRLSGILLLIAHLPISSTKI